MEEILKEELRAGEEILWKGKPEKFETLDVTHKNAIIIKAIIICGVVLALCVAYAVFTISKGIEFKFGLVAIAIAIAVYTSIHGLIEGKNMAKVDYVITDQRMMVVSSVAKGVEYAAIKEAEFRTDADGHTSLLCGERAIKSKPHNWRMLTLGGAHLELETGLCESFVFYAIPDVDRVKRILSDFLPL